MTPSQTIIREAVGVITTVDSRGRRLTLRRLTALDTLRLVKAAGPLLAQNEAWLSMAALAFSILEIDGIPVPPPATEPQIESLIERLGEEGLAATADAIKQEQEPHEAKSNLGNLPGTLS